MADENSDETKRSGGRRAVGDFAKVESMVQLAIALPAACLIGWLLGAWLDSRFHTGWIGLVGIGVGAVAGFVQIFTTASRMLKRGDE